MRIKESQNYSKDDHVMMERVSFIILAFYHAKEKADRSRPVRAPNHRTIPRRRFSRWISPGDIPCHSALLSDERRSAFLAFRPFAVFDTFACFAYLCFRFSAMVFSIHERKGRPNGRPSANMCLVHNDSSTKTAEMIPVHTLNEVARYSCDECIRLPNPLARTSTLGLLADHEVSVTCGNFGQSPHLGRIEVKLHLPSETRRHVYHALRSLHPIRSAKRKMVFEPRNALGVHSDCTSRHAEFFFETTHCDIMEGIVLPEFCRLLRKREARHTRGSTRRLDEKSVLGVMKYDANNERALLVSKIGRHERRMDVREASEQVRHARVPVLL